MGYYEKIEQQGYYIIAEVGVNYYDIAKKNSISIMDAAKLMIEEAAKAGADAVKFQTYKANTLASKYSPAYWDQSEESASSQYELFLRYDHFGEKEYVELAEYSKTVGIDFLSTPFDFESVDYLDALMEVYKISSSDLTNLPMIEKICEKGKPIILSIGASNKDEIDRAVEVIRKINGNKLTLLHCVLEYPTPYEHANLKKISSLVEEYSECIVGYSDHTKPDVCMDVIKAAYLLGAKTIEKHFTLDKTLIGNDHYHAMDPEDLRKIKYGLEFYKLLGGSGELACLESEANARKFARRSLVAKCDIVKGCVITEDMLTEKRPGTGISPANICQVVGKKAAIDIENDTIIQKEMIE